MQQPAILMCGQLVNKASMGCFLECLPVHSTFFTSLCCAPAGSSGATCAERGVSTRPSPWTARSSRTAASFWRPGRPSRRRQVSLVSLHCLHSTAAAWWLLHSLGLTVSLG